MSKILAGNLEVDQGYYVFTWANNLYGQIIWPVEVNVSDAAYSNIPAKNSRICSEAAM